VACAEKALAAERKVLRSANLQIEPATVRNLLLIFTSSLLVEQFIRYSVHHRPGPSMAGVDLEQASRQMLHKAATQPCRQHGWKVRCSKRNVALDFCLGETLKDKLSSSSS
jgi:hypothetical protein